MRTRHLARRFLVALSLLGPAAASAQALPAPSASTHEWAVFREGAAPAACFVCRRSPKPGDCPGAEVARTSAPTSCESFATARDMLRRGECTKVSLRGFTVGDCGPR